MYFPTILSLERFYKLFSSHMVLLNARQQDLDQLHMKRERESYKNRFTSLKSLILSLMNLHAILTLLHNAFPLMFLFEAFIKGNQSTAFDNVC